MKALVAVAVTVLLVVSGSGVLIAADSPETASGTTMGTTPEEGDADPAKTSPAGEDAKTTPLQDASEPDTKGSTMNVNRHRPGACPEGPPCKEGD